MLFLPILKIKKSKSQDYLNIYHLTNNLEDNILSKIFVEINKYLLLAFLYVF